MFTLNPLASTPAVATAEQRELFESLMRGCYRQAGTLAYRLTGNSAEAEDLVQETFLRAFRFFHRYDRSLPFTSWIYRIMTNVHIDRARRGGRLRTTSLDSAGSDGTTMWEIADEDANPERPILDRELAAPLQMALKSMTPDFRIAVLLADVEGMAYEEIAEIMEVSIGTVRSRIHRGRRQIRQYLDSVCPGQFAEVSS